MTSEISKLDAASRHVNGAIRLFLSNEDAVVVHTVAMAAFGILKDLAKNAGSPTHKMFDHLIRPEKKKEFWKLFKSNASFFKHADFDPDGRLPSFKEVQNENVIFLSCLYLHDLDAPPSPEVRAYYNFYVLLRPEFMNERGLEEFKKLLPMLRDYSISDRKEAALLWIESQKTKS